MVPPEYVGPLDAAILYRDRTLVTVSSIAKEEQVTKRHTQLPVVGELPEEQVVLRDPLGGRYHGEAVRGLKAV